MVAPEPAAGGAAVTPTGIADDRFVLDRAIRQRLVLTCMRLSEADRYRELCGAELALGDLDDSDPAALRTVDPVGEIGRIYDDAQLDAVLPAAYVAFRGERVEAPASADAKVQAAYQSWSVVLVVPMETATAGAPPRPAPWPRASNGRSAAGCPGSGSGATPAASPAWGASPASPAIHRCTNGSGRSWPSISATKRACKAHERSDMSKPMPSAPRQKRVLARSLVQAGEHRAIGETVELRPDQIARLEPEGYFEAPAPAPADKGGKSK